MKMLLIRKNYSIALILFAFYSCGSGDAPSLAELNEELEKEKENAGLCGQMTVADFHGFLGVKDGTPEDQLAEILPGEVVEEYSEDSTIYKYIFDDQEGISTHVNVDPESGEILFYNILLNGETLEEVKALQSTMNENYEIDKCHNQFFMLPQKEIEKIMGDENTERGFDSGSDYWLEYDDEESGHAVHFYFPPEEELGCIMIRILYNW